MTVWDEIEALVHGARTFHDMAMLEEDEDERERLQAKSDRWLADAETLREMATNGNLQAQT